MTSKQYAELYDLAMDGYRARVRDPSLGGPPSFCIVAELARALRDDEVTRFHLGIKESHANYLARFNKEEPCADLPIVSESVSKTSASVAIPARSSESA